MSGDTLHVGVMKLAHAADLPLPEYASPGAAGLDVRAAVSEPVEIAPGARRAIPTGLVLEIPTGWEIQLRPRSGLALRHGLTLANAPGTVDSDFRGEVQVVLQNLGDVAVSIERGMRIAQMVLQRVPRLRWDERRELAASERDSGGFGSTGTR